MRLLRLIQDETYAVAKNIFIARSTRFHLGSQYGRRGCQCLGCRSCCYQGVACRQRHFVVRKADNSCNKLTNKPEQCVLAGGNDALGECFVENGNKKNPSPIAFNGKLQSYDLAANHEKEICPDIIRGSCHLCGVLVRLP